MQMQMQGKVAPRRIENLMAGPVVCTPRTRNYGPDQNAEGQLLLSPEAPGTMLWGAHTLYRTQ